MERTLKHFYGGLMAIFLACPFLGYGIVTLFSDKEQCGAILSGIAAGLLIDGIILLKNYKRLDMFEKEQTLLGINKK
ncbi:hypothetical protein AGMMS49965_10500 [Bacteroidia bacterium]|nr:hypothetical protein AGMMS49965_10500 [Bacteroidia bacterium]